MTVPYKGGAPRKYETPEELTQKIIEYFQYIDDINKKRKEDGDKLKPYTISGLCNYLDIVRDTWIEYGKKSEYADSVKKAKQTVEEYVEEGMINGSLSTIGSIFNLKNNFGWVDKIDIATTTQPEQLTPADIRNQLAQRKKNGESDDGQE
jgi:hypothetical protein